MSLVLRFLVAMAVRLSLTVWGIRVRYFMDYQLRVVRCLSQSSTRVVSLRRGAQVFISFSEYRVNMSVSVGNILLLSLLGVKMAKRNT